MHYHSTRGHPLAVDFVGALLGGLAPDGGLYIPDAFPRLPASWEQWSYVEAVAGSLELFGAGDVIDLVKESAARFDHPDIAPIVEVGDRLIFELFHGPTLSFKDHALQVLVRLLSWYGGSGTVLGATSGDTGAAAIEACRGILPIVILFPEGRLSELQRRQMTTVTGQGLRVVAVRGTFDDCQAMVKTAFETMPGLLAVNSINWARIAAQVGYYLHAAARIRVPFDVVVPTGNFGNVYSCWVAKQMGAPIETIVVATNANRFLADLVISGKRRISEVVPTVAPAMDIQVPSNLERLPIEALDVFEAGWAEDGEIMSTMAKVFDGLDYLLDPHTAAAWAVGEMFRTARPQLVVATAHPVKFPDVVTEATGLAPPVPDALAGVASATENFVTIDPDIGLLLEMLSL